MAEIRNPNQQGPGAGGDSRSILIMSVIFLAVFLGIQYFRKTVPQPQPQQSTSQGTQSTQPGNTTAGPTAQAAMGAPGA
ncbi:MAG TPA: hypothetical protein VGD64_15290, partial [Acidisarcina sp.]